MVWNNSQLIDKTNIKFKYN